MQNPQEFFNALYGTLPDEYIAELRFIPEGGGVPTRLYRPANQVQHGNFQALTEINQHSHIYHRVNLSLEKRSRKDDIALLVALWLDIDGRPEDAINQFSEMELPPTMLVDSGGGWHLYWLLKDPVALTNSKERFEVERTMQGMVLALGNGLADEKTKDCTRILRTPYFRNIKAKYAPDYPIATVAWYDDSRGDRYHFNSLYKRYSPLGTPQAPVVRRQLPALQHGERPKWIMEYFASGAGEGSRNQRLFVVARYFNDIGEKSSAVEQDLISRALADGLSQSEAATTIRSAWNQAPNAGANVPSHMRRIIGIEDNE